MKEQITIALSPEGEIYLNNQLIEMPQFEDAIKLAGDLTPDLPVLLVADENVPLKHVTTVMDVCRGNKLNKIRLQSR